MELVVSIMYLFCVFGLLFQVQKVNIKYLKALKMEAKEGQGVLPLFVFIAYENGANNPTYFIEYCDFYWKYLNT